VPAGNGATKRERFDDLVDVRLLMVLRRADHMGKRSAVVGLLLGNMGSMQRETRPSMQRKDQPAMATKLEQIAVKLGVNQIFASPLWPITSRVHGC